MVCTVNYRFMMLPNSTEWMLTFETQHLPMQVCLNTERPCIWHIQYFSHNIVSKNGSWPNTGDLADGRKWSSLVSLGFTFIWDNSVMNDYHAMPPFGANAGSTVTFM